VPPFVPGGHESPAISFVLAVQVIVPAPETRVACAEAQNPTKTTWKQTSWAKSPWLTMPPAASD